LTLLISGTNNISILTKQRTTETSLPTKQNMKNVHVTSTFAKRFFHNSMRIPNFKPNHSWRVLIMI